MPIQKRFSVETVSNTITADEIIIFIKSYCIPNLLPEQEKWIRDIFHVDPETQIRRINRVILSMPKKNGKTELCAALALAHLLLKSAGTQHIIAIGPKRDRALLIIKKIKEVVYRKGNEDLHLLPPDRRGNRKPFLIIRNHSIENIKTLSRLETRAGDSENIHGDNPTLILVDEFGACPRELYAVLSDSQTNVDGGIGGLCIITSHQYPDPTNPLESRLRQIRNGRDSSSPKAHKYPNWYIVNKQGTLYTQADADRENREHGRTPSDPDYVTVRQMNLREENAISCNFLRWKMDPDSIRQKIIDAEDSNEAYADYLTYFLNVPAGEADSFIPYSRWAAKGDSTLQLEGFKGRDCYLALDLSRRVDLTALAWFFPRDNVCFCDFWMPAEQVVEQSKRDGEKYGMWKMPDPDTGVTYLTVNPGSTIDYNLILNRLYYAEREFNVLNIRYDAWSFDSLMDKHENRVEAYSKMSAEEKREFASPVLPEDFEQVRQGYSLSPMMDDLEYLVLNENSGFSHPDNPLLNMCIKNLVATDDPRGRVTDSRKPDKRSKGVRIDGAVALLMAVRVPKDRVTILRAQKTPTVATSSDVKPSEVKTVDDVLKLASSGRRRRRSLR